MLKHPGKESSVTGVQQFIHFLDALITNPADAYAFILKHGFLNRELIVSVNNRFTIKESNELRLCNDSYSVCLQPLFSNAD